ncbi:hypothetical protein GOQ27_09685 [Clostridium sp. D2Q-11]|uniref:Amidase n=1 Tax=Anaeromonas frigoriresistens TaxID=2683708 RepID=A0A942UWC0_9FIRM|nr:amidase family protein [Anaeromonas frigoriresistens]MBS4538735.1 hypothetical protein [Anaeromonas frigoriresistens]
MDSTQKNILMQMNKVSKAVLKAKEEEGSVVYCRKEILEEAVITLEENPDSSLVLFGVKNTEEIDKKLVERLKENNGYLFHTIDKMSERGRAIDIDLINPLTGRVMTGSSSGGCVNILKGINDLAIGTDGGGSVLAPAISTGLFSIMAKGMGLKGTSIKASTDNIKFTPGIGVISHSYDICKSAIETLITKKNVSIDENKNEKIKIVIPKKESILLPNGIDMRESLNGVIDGIKDSVEIIEKDFNKIESRLEAIPFCEEIFKEDIDIIITMEGPIDIYGLGDSVLGTWGKVGSNIQNESGKYLLKVANMIDATAVTIPTRELGIGVLIIAKKGLESGKSAIKLGDMIRKLYSVPELYSRYFIEGYKKKNKGFI